MNVRPRGPHLPIALLLAALPLHAEITAVSVDGLKRTRPRVAEAPLERFIGRDPAGVTEAEVFAVILDTGILEPVSMDLVDADGGATLAVTVREKWAFFPIPFISIGGGSSTYGGAVMDANAFGLNDKLVAAGAYMSGGWMATLMYAHTSGKPGALGWSAAVFYASQEREDTDQRETVLRRFGLDAASATFRLSYPFTAALSASLGLSYGLTAVRGVPDALLAPDAGRQALALNPAVTLRRSAWDGYLLSEQSVSLSYSASLGGGGGGLGGDSSLTLLHEASLRGSVDLTITPGFRAVLRAALAAQSSAGAGRQDAFSESSVSGMDILPNTYRARHYAAVSAGLEKHLVKFSFGTLSVLAAYQGALSTGALLGAQADHGPMAAARLYLSKLAIPALSLGAAYDVAAGEPQVVFSIGMSL